MNYAEPLADSPYRETIFDSYGDARRLLWNAQWVAAPGGYAATQFLKCGSV
ncbi:MAG TPA: hypothetical protein VHV08_02695 [Pirellulales bacterium]|jgi:hypothetical protein|nr:hypothetical protein [Pirellulales bacterium]